MHQRFKPKDQASLAEDREEQILRQAFHLWKREIKPPSWVWEEISRQVHQMESGRESQTATSKQS